MSRKLTLQEVQQIFISAKYTPLFTEYNSKLDSLDCLCPNGHHIKKTIQGIRTGQKCIKCKNESQKLTLKQAKQRFIDIGYIPLFNSYINSEEKLKFECDKGHIGYLDINHLKSGTRCSECNNEKKRFSLEEVKKFIMDRGYTPLFDFYQNKDQKLKMKCSKGHIFEMSLRSFRGTKNKKACGCRECSYTGKNNRYEIMNKRYGGVLMGSSIIKKKIQETMGYSNPMKNPKIVEKTKKTNLKRYGVENVMHCPDIFYRKQSDIYLRKTLITPKGNTLYLQGYEPRAYLQLLSEGYSENDILTNIDVPMIDYKWNDGTDHKYYPDFYIPKDNLIIEVKSEYTYQISLDINLLKFKAVKKRGYDFRLIKYC